MWNSKAACGLALLLSRKRLNRKQFDLLAGLRFDRIGVGAGNFGLLILLQFDLGLLSADQDFQLPEKSTVMSLFSTRPLARSNQTVPLAFLLSSLASLMVKGRPPMPSVFSGLA